MIDLAKIDEVRQLVKDCGREIVLVAASKTQTSETINEFKKVAPDFILGENRVQELIEKYDPNYTWHFIGQLQTNKVKYIIDKVELIHSLDRDELAKEIEKQATKHNKIQHCLVEINMGAEITKGGVEPNDVIEFISSLEKYEHIQIDGIMSVLPSKEKCEDLDALYEKLFEIFEETKNIKQKNVNIKYLSAGMSGDYETALKHGSNMIRLGRVIFGERNYNKV